MRLQGGSFDTDLNYFYAAVDRRMLDFAMGLDTEFSELVEGSHLCLILASSLLLVCLPMNQESPLIFTFTHHGMSPFTLSPTLRYFPKVDLANVVLAAEQKALILDTVTNFEEYKRARRRVGFDDKVLPFMWLLISSSPRTTLHSPLDTCSTPSNPRLALHSSSPSFYPSLPIDSVVAECFTFLLSRVLSDRGVTGR